MTTASSRRPGQYLPKYLTLSLPTPHSIPPDVSMFHWKRQPLPDLTPEVFSHNIGLEFEIWYMKDAPVCDQHTLVARYNTKTTPLL